MAATKLRVVLVQSVKMVAKYVYLCLASVLATVALATMVQQSSGSSGGGGSSSSYSYSINMTYYIDGQGCHVGGKVYGFGTQFPLDVQGPCFWFQCSYMQLSLIRQDFGSCMVPGQQTCFAIGARFTLPSVTGTCRCDHAFRLMCSY